MDTMYDVYIDVDENTEALLGTFINVQDIKDALIKVNKQQPGIIVKFDDFNASMTIGDIERSANTRIDPYEKA